MYTSQMIPGGTHGQVIMFTGRWPEIDFTRSNSFLEDTQLRQLLRQTRPYEATPVPGSACSGSCRSICASGPGLPPHPTPTGPAPALSSALLAPADPHVRPLGAAAGVKVCLVSLLAPNTKEVFKTRESYSSQWTFGSMRGDLRIGAPPGTSSPSAWGSVWSGWGPGSSPRSAQAPSGQPLPSLSLGFFT